MKKNLTLKNMIEVMKNVSYLERDKVLATFWNMKCLGFIADETWDKFIYTCKGFRFCFSNNMDIFKF